MNSLVQVMVYLRAYCLHGFFMYMASSCILVYFLYELSRSELYLFTTRPTYHLTLNQSKVCYSAV